MAGRLNSYEIAALEMVAGSRPVEGGAWVSICLEVLFICGYITNFIGQMPALTDKGAAALKEPRDDR